MSFGFGFGFPSWRTLAGGFSPAALFVGGVQGAWYDPSDLSTLFTTSAGTTPVAMPGQGSAVSVGAMLDKRATGYSNYFDGSGDYLSVLDSAAFDFGAGEFTAEAWVYGTSGNVSQYTTICSQSIQNATSDSAWFVSAGTSGMTLYLSTSGNSWTNFIEINSGITNNQWFHVAFQRRGNTLEIYRNGVLQTPTSGNSSFSGTVFNSSRTPFIGAQQASPSVNHLTGYISNLRIVKGTAVYTGNFTPSTSPLTAISGTSLLTCGNSWSGNPAITRNGDVRVDGLNPFTASPVGNHAIAFNNTTARPELRARVNLLTYSEEFDNGAWTKQGATIPATNNLAPDGTLTARTIRQTATNTYHAILQTPFTSTGATQTFSAYVKQGTSQFAYLNIQSGSLSTQWITCVVDLSAGVITQQTAGAGGTLVSATITPAANNFWRVVLTGTIPAGTAFYGLVGMATSGTPTLGAYGVETFLGSTSNEIIAWGADLRPANIGANVPAYQRIADANTYDTNGFPLYLLFEGSVGQRGMYTPANLDLSATDKVAVFAGVRKLSAAGGTIVEFSSTSANPGSFNMAANGVAVNDYFFGVNGTSLLFGYNTGFAPPVSNVLTEQLNQAGATDAQRVSARSNGAALPLTYASNIGTPGNFGTYPLYIGSRANSTVWFNGHLYSLVVAGSAVSAGNISATEQWVANKTGIVIP